MGILGALKRLFSSTPSQREGQSFDPELFVYIRIPAPIEPLERAERFEDPLQEWLDQDSLCTVSGGGSSLSNERPDGSRVVEWCGIDVDVTSLKKALELLRKRLSELGLPDGSELEYTEAGDKLRDIFERGVWRVGERRVNQHPGFDV